MGQEIVYCARCLQRLTGGDFDKGKAMRLGSRIACLECYPHVLAGLDPAERARLEAPPPPSSRRLPPRAPSTTSLRAPSTPSRNPLPLVLAGAAAAVALGGFFLTSRPSPEPPPPASPPPSSRPPAVVVRPPPPPPQEDASALRAARQALTDAETLRTSKPDDLDAHVAAFEEAVRRADRTPLYPEAVKAYDAAVAALKQRRAKDAEALEREVKEAASRGDLRAGRDACARAAGNSELAALAARLDMGLRTRAEELVADAAGGGGDRGAFRAKVESWGWPDLVALLDRGGEERPWRPIFQGNLDFMMDFFKPKWEVQGGALVPRGDAFSGKTREEFGDCEVRFRFEFETSGNFYIRVRQDGTGHLGLNWSRVELEALRRKPVEVVVVVRGDRLEATANGRPMPVDRLGSPRRGPIQFGGAGKGYRLHAIEMRP